MTGPWTEAEYFALGETNERIELIDGNLRASLAPARSHQGILFQLLNLLNRAARAAGLTPSFGIDVRLAPGHLVTPDFVIGKPGRESWVSEAADVVLACEITSPDSAAYDRHERMALYAAAGIDWLLLAEPDTPDYTAVDLLLNHLDGASYTEHSAAEYGQTLTSETPFPLEIPTAQLLREMTIEMHY